MGATVLSMPLTFEVAVQPIEGGGFWGEFVRFPGCVAQAETLEALAVSLAEALAEWADAEPGKTEADARALAALQGSDEPLGGPFPERVESLPPGWSDDDD